MRNRERARAIGIAVILGGCLSAPTPAQDDPDARPPAARCSPGPHEFLMFATPRSWQAAATACNQVGGDLAIVKGGGDRGLVRNLIEADAWLGAVDLDSDGDWHYVDGTDAMPDWGMDEPSAAPDDECVAIHAADGKDHAEVCTRQHAYVCGCNQ